MNPDIVARLRKNFCIDANLNLPSISDPYFYYYIYLFEEHYQSKTMWDLYLKDLSLTKDIDLFLCNRKRLIDSILDYFQNNEYYVNNKNFVLKNETSQDIRSNIKKWVGDIFVSIDLKEANFLAMNTIHDKILNSNNWDEFIRKFENSDFLARSKHFRQFIFGKLNTKTLSSIQKNIIKNLYLSIKDINALQLVEVHHDELIFCVSDLSNLNVNEISERIIKFANLKEYNFRIQAFTKESYSIKNTYPDKKIFLKTYIDINTMQCIRHKPMMVPSHYLPQFIKYITRKPIDPWDLLFKHEDSLLSRFVEPLEFQHLHLD